MCHMCHNLITDLGQTQSKDLIAEVIVQQSKTQFFKSMKRRDLAQQYFPESSPRAAVKGLLRWIDNCPELVAALEKLNIPFRHKINLTARQVRIIMYYLGDP